MFKLHQERLDIENSLGSGNFGEVFPYQKNPQDLKWVVKCIFAKNVDTLISFLPEIVLGFACDHPCIVPVKGYFIQKEQGPPPGFRLFLKFPRMKESLADNFKDRKTQKNPFTEKEIIQHFYSLACGLQYLHAKKIYHGDIRHNNLLLDGSGKLKIADVGIAKHVEDEDSYQTIMGQKGTYEYSAPEVLGEKAKKKTLSKGDVWSLGVVILELCLFETKLLNSQLPQNKLQAQLEELLGKLEGKSQESLKGLIRRMLSLDPEERPCLEQIKSELEENFLKILDQDLLDQIFVNNKMTAMNQRILQEISKKFDIERQEEAKEIDRLQREKIFFERAFKNLEIKMKKNFEDYENQIKSLQESLQQAQFGKGQLDFTTEKAVESSGEEYVRKLDEVVSQLNQRWSTLFLIQAVGKVLVVSEKGREGFLMKSLEFFLETKRPTRGSEILMMLEEITLILRKNNLLNLFGLEIYLDKSSWANQQNLSGLGTLMSVLSSPSLEHLILDLRGISSSPSNIQNLLETIALSAKHIKRSEFYFFTRFLWSEEIESIKKRFPNFTRLEIHSL